MSENLRRVIFAHGKESGPWGLKISHLARLARVQGWAVSSPDFQGVDDPDRRVTQLVREAASEPGPLVLAGTSLGGYVCAQACSRLPAAALFLMAPALYFPGHDQEPGNCPKLCTVVHGWRDDIVPPERAWRFAQRHRAKLLMLDSGHTLSDQLDTLGEAFVELLDKVDS